MLRYQGGYQPHAHQDSLQAVLLAKLRCLRELILQCERERIARANLSKNLQSEILTEVMESRTNLLALHSTGMAGLRGENLENRLATLGREKRQELVSAWQDIRAIRREFRTWLKEYVDLLQRVRLLLPDYTTGPTVPIRLR